MKGSVRRNISDSVCPKSKHDPVAHIARVTQRKEASRTISFIDTSLAMITHFICFPQTKLAIWYQFYCESAPADRELITDALRCLLSAWCSWYHDTPYHTLCITFEMEFVIVSQNIPGIRFAALTRVPCCCQKRELTVKCRSWNPCSPPLSGSWTGICVMVWDSKWLSSRNLHIWQHLSRLSLVSVRAFKSDQRKWGNMGDDRGWRRSTWP